MLLLPMAGNWNLWCFGGPQIYDVIYRDIRSDDSTDEASGERDRQRVQ